MILRGFFVVLLGLGLSSCTLSGGGSCSSGADCDPGEVCHNGACHKNDFEPNRGGGDPPDAGPTGPVHCRATEDCPEDQYCYLGTAECRDLIAPACRSNAQCRPGENCRVDEGRSIGICEGGAGNCLGDADCAAGERCQDGRCVPLASGDCVDRSDCPASQSCQEGRCVTLPSRLGQDCDPDTDCGSGESCIRVTETDSVCTEACGRGDDCPSGFFCYNLAGGRICIDDRFLTLDGNAIADLRTGDRCVQENATRHCQSLLCLGQLETTCRSNCARDAHCQSGQVCHLFQGLREDNSTFMVDVCAEPGEFGTRPGRAGPGGFCSDHGNCRSGACFENSCRTLCCNSSDCPGGEVCVLQSFVLDAETTRMANICAPAPEGISPGQASAGATCRQPTDCRSARCLIPTGQDSGFCLDSCCGHQECGGSSICMTNFLEGPPAALVNLCLP